MIEKIKLGIEKIIFFSKWLLIPFYLKLFWTLSVLLYWFITNGRINNEELIYVLEAVDVIMIANLVKMICTGSYHSFVSKTHGDSAEKVGSGALKVKIVTSIIGVTSIHLLQTFISAENIVWDVIYKQIAIHSIFLIGALILAVIDFLHIKSENFETKH